MLTKLKIALTAMVLLALSSCEVIRDDYADCGVWLEFVFDHNMEYADSFDPQVKTVDVHIFDRAGKFVQARHAATNDLDGRKRMFLSNLPFGEYKILTVGNLGPSFGFTDRSSEAFKPGVTSIDDAVLALKTAHASQEFDHLFFGLSVEVDYKADLSVYRIPLIRETNKLNVVLQTAATNLPYGTMEGSVTPVHTVEITAPEAGAYDCLNNPTVPRGLVYRPYSLLSRLEYTELGIQRETAARLNTMRLLENEWDGYRITVRDIETGNELWSNDLLSLLAATKPARRPDGTNLSRSEYFDREGGWNIVIVYRSGNTQTPNPFPDKAFIALRIYVNGWIVWQNSVGV